ncbi:MAG: hypothetical protein O3A53_09880 [Acidobacteria bacterium]|nr:hypothetical protein [Acidobacteriota bacterium]MDA1235101.1 hypothetical protein [Acidobacteriota bacterium]
MSAAKLPLGEATGLANRTFALGLAILAAAYVLVAAWAYSPALFGAYHDDTLYFSAAKALAAGDGSVLPNLPDSPAQTKYPPLYPLLLSLVWRVQPEFPENLSWAWSLNLAFGVVLVLASVGVLRRLGSSRKEALGLAAIFALNPYTILWTNLLLSDVLFAALTLLAVLAADRAVVQREGSFWSWWAAAIVLAWLATTTRTLGVAILGGLFVFAIVNRRYLAGAATCFGVLPLVWRLLAGSSAGGSAPTSPVSGFDQTWLFYTDYVAFWKLSVPSLDVLWAQVQFNGLELLKFPAVNAFLYNAEGMASIYMQTTAIAISAAILHGVYVRAKNCGHSSIHWMAVCYVPFILLWNYTLMSRFWLAFMPLFLVGAAVELRRLTGGIRKVFAQSSQLDQRIAAGFFGLALSALVLNGAWRYAVVVPKGLRSVAAHREKTLAAKQEAYDWLAHSNETGPVISYEDALLYLYTGAQGMRPFICSTEPFFRQDEDAMKRDISRIGDTAAALNAHYWIVSDDDFGLDYAGPLSRAE